MLNEVSENMPYSAPLFTVFLSLSIITQIRNAYVSPQGCTYNHRAAVCDFLMWNPPLLDTDFGPEPLFWLELTNINGNIPAGAFSGLNGPHTNRDTYVYFYCNNGKTILSRGIFSDNLYWVITVSFFDCYIENGLPSRFLENLKSLQFLTIWRGGIDHIVAHDAFAGLTNLKELTVQAQVKIGRLPIGLLEGLSNLTRINLQASKLNCIVAGLFNGLVLLERIYLSDNNLQTLPQGIFDGLDSLTNVQLYNNPWDCSCELMWLLEWSHITVGGTCYNPLNMIGFDLEEGLRMSNCTQIIITNLTTSVCLEDEVTDTQTPPSTTFAVSSTSDQTRTLLMSTPGLTVSSIATSSQKEWITPAGPLPDTKEKIVTSTVDPMTMISSSISRNITVAYSLIASTIAYNLIASTTMSFPIGFWSASTEYKTGIPNKSFSLSSILYAPSASMPTIYSATPSAPVSLNSRNSTAGDENTLRNLLLISGGAVLAGSVAVAALLYRYIIRETCVER